MVDWGRLRRSWTHSDGARGVGSGQVIPVGLDQVGWGHMGR